MKISGSLYTRNAINAGYPFREAIESMLAVCDAVLVMDACSKDGTLRALLDMARKHKSISVAAAMTRGAGRFEEYARLVRARFRTHWHLMLQADEVLHESSLPFLRETIKENPKNLAISVRRINLFEGIDTCIADRAPHSPFCQRPYRLGSRLLRLTPDGHGFALPERTRHNNDIVLFHYGSAEQRLQHTREVRSWFFTPEGLIDSRILEAQSQKGFDPLQKLARSEIVPLDMPHPKVMENWIAAWRSKK